MMRGALSRLSIIHARSAARRPGNNFVKDWAKYDQTEYVHQNLSRCPGYSFVLGLRPATSSYVPFHERHFQVAAKNAYHTSTLYCTQNEISADTVTKFINSQNDLDNFLGEIEELCLTDKHRKYWGPMSKENLQRICNHLLGKNCDCMNIYSFVKSNPSLIAANQECFHYNLNYLHDLGFRGNNLLYVLNQRPDIWRMKQENIQERVKQLWDLGLGDGYLKKAILSYPQILSIKRKRFQSIIELLRKLQFTSQHISQILAESPQIFEDDEYEIELKFQYVLFMMGVTDYKEILKAKIFNYSHDHIRLRHLTLERLGLYQVPDKHGRTKVRNPALCRIVDSTDKRFAATCARISPEELNSFSDSLREELAEQEASDEDVTSSDSDESDDD